MSTMTEPRFVWWQFVIVTSTLVALIATAVGTGTAFTTLPVLWFLAVCPGMAFVRLLAMEDPVLRWISAIGLSVALGAVVAEALLFAHLYTGFRTIVVLGVLACAGAVIGRRRARGNPEPADAPVGAARPLG
jgi:small-conductance mechanosensitive channel